MQAVVTSQKTLDFDGEQAVTAARSSTLSASLVSTSLLIVHLGSGDHIDCSILSLRA